MKLSTTSSFVEHRSAVALDVDPAVANMLVLGAPGACTCCLASTCCSCCCSAGAHPFELTAQGRGPG